jgi:hypothetical protein
LLALNKSTAVERLAALGRIESSPIEPKVESGLPTTPEGWVTYAAESSRN